MTIIKKLYGRQIVVADIHGCLKTFKHLIHDTLQIRKDDQVIMLGDYISRGPSSAGVIDHIMHLQNSGYLIYPLRGNHEQKLLDTIHAEKTEFENYIHNLRLEGLVSNATIKPRYYDFFYQLPYFYQLDNYLLVHGGFNFNSPDPFKDYTSMLWIKDYEPDPLHLSDYTIIHGHQPHYLETIKERIQNRSLRIPLDNGIAHNKYHPRLDVTRLRRLCGLELNTMRLYTVSNIDMKMEYPRYSPN